jgi:hypothetical protein
MTKAQAVNRACRLTAKIELLEFAAQAEGTLTSKARDGFTVLLEELRMESAGFAEDLELDGFEEPERRAAENCGESAWA